MKFNEQDRDISLIDHLLESPEDELVEFKKDLCNYSARYKRQTYLAHKVRVLTVEQV